MNTIADYRQAFEALVRQQGLLAQPVRVEVKPLSVEQAIGQPERDDFPIQKGRERIIEADFLGSPGQAFTDSFRDYQGDLAGLLSLDLRDRFQASLFIAASNAVLAHLGLVDKTVHCRDGEPAQCARLLVDYLRQEHPQARKLALVGLQPAMAQALAPVYELAILDLDPANLGRQVAGATVQDGATRLNQVVAAADLVLATGSTLANNSLDLVRQAAGPRPLVFFGVTVAGAARLLGLERFCPLGH